MTASELRVLLSNLVGEGNKKYLIMMKCGLIALFEQVIFLIMSDHK